MKGSIMNTITQSQPETQNQPHAVFPPAPPRASTEQDFESKGRTKGRRRLSSVQAEALHNAINNFSHANYITIFQGFMAKGIAFDDIHPRENVFTFNAWKALSRTVRKGEHGVRILTFVPCEKKDKETGKTSKFLRPKSTTVFHVSQTEEL
jgi:hypothetical protein